ncbi:hypothetical protein [Jannaschia pohangensis]|uniref:Uncharacterized protein n=1 Tax=Jannaschia pohangensis TaxID=390807 RepID=A0A1I3JAC3_9RHOB|nr:hypothetical protein [Jannaschia pohangensis]SFI57212.1 hypothetical protein SAMN04488095_1264 [Jannaschia pohangensis]
MSRHQFAEDWVPFRDPLLSTYPELTDGDLAEADGSTAALARTIARKQGVGPDDAQRDLHAFLDGPMPADAYADPSHDDAAVAESGAYIPEGEDALADDARFGDDGKAENPVGRKT